MRGTSEGRRRWGGPPASYMTVNWASSQGAQSRFCFSRSVLRGPSAAKRMGV